jgi:hypothetical protein
MHTMSALFMCSLEAGRPEQHRESSLKYQTRCVRAYPDGGGYALSSVEGRIAMEFFSEADQVSMTQDSRHLYSSDGGAWP